MISHFLKISSFIPQSNQFYNIIITLIGCIIICLTLCWFVLYELGIKNKEKFKIEPRVWSGIFFGLLTLAIFILHLTYNTINTDVQLINVIIIPILVGIITSLFAPLVQSFFDSNYVDNRHLSSVPCKIYPPSESEPEGDSEFKTDLVESMRESNNYCYMGVDMTVASQCLDKVFNNNGNHEITKMLFIISDPNCKNWELNIARERKKKEKEKLKSSIEKINKICSTAAYRIAANFYILPNRPPLHIHKTDGMCFWGVVDKTGKYQCPTTYSYKKDDEVLSMFKTIEHLIQQTTDRVDRNELPCKKIEINSWEGQGKQNLESDKITITYNGNQKTVSIDEFVNEIEIEYKSK